MPSHGTTAVTLASPQKQSHASPRSAGAAQSYPPYPFGDAHSVALQPSWSEAASSLAAKIKAAIASKSDLAEGPLDGFKLSKDELKGLAANDITNVGHLAGANVDDVALHAVVAAGARTSHARIKLWKLIGLAANRLDVRIGALPKMNGTGTKRTQERPKAHQRVPDGVANCYTWLIG